MRSEPRRIEERLARRGGALELLRAPALLFAGLARARNALYDRSLLPSARLSATVVSVGNLTTGGTGKTPLVAWLARELEARGRRVGLLSRGYGRARGAATNDEGELLARLLPGLPHVQGKDRIAGGLELERQGCDTIVLDDGFQHRRLSRDLDLVLIDATRPWGLPPLGGEAELRAVLPRGLLREPPAGLTRADALILSRADQASGEELLRLEAQLRAIAPGKPILRAAHVPRGVREQPGARAGGTGELLPPAALAGRAVTLLSAIGNPAAFEAAARALGADVRAVHSFPDHHRFEAADLVGLARAGSELLVTAKDAVKLAPLGAAFLVLEIEFAWLCGAAVMEALLDALPSAASRLERSALHEGLHG